MNATKAERSVKKKTNNRFDQSLRVKIDKRQTMELDPFCRRPCRTRKVSPTFAFVFAMQNGWLYAGRSIQWESVPDDTTSVATTKATMAICEEKEERKMVGRFHTTKNKAVMAAAEHLLRVLQHV
jgi:hypothetical protein